MSWLNTGSDCTQPVLNGWMIGFLICAFFGGVSGSMTSFLLGRCGTTLTGMKASHHLGRFGRFWQRRGG